jgi:HEAT repeat protein
VLGVLVVFLLACGSGGAKRREQLADPNPDVRIAALKALAEARDTVAVPKIVELLADTEPDVRKEAARALGRIGDRRAVEPLAGFYRSEQVEDVADAGARALIQFGAAAIEPFTGLLSSIRPTVRAGAARALGKLKAHEAVAALIRALGDRDERVQIAAVYALREIGDPAGLEAIARAVETGDGAAEAAGEAALSGRGYQGELNRAKRLSRRVPYP